MTENCVEIASLVRQMVIDTLKKSAPGISEIMRSAIADSIAIKLRATLVPDVAQETGLLECECPSCGYEFRRRASTVTSQHSGTET